MSSEIGPPREESEERAAPVSLPNDYFSLPFNPVLWMTVF